MTVMAMMSTRTRESEPRSRALSLRALTLESVRVCCRCTRAKGLGLLACVSPSLATPLWTTRGCGGSILATARPWKLTSTSTRSVFAWAVLVPRNPSLVLPATQAFWTRVQRMPPAAPLGRPRGDTTPSHPSCMQQHSSAITPLKWRFPVSFLART